MSVVTAVEQAPRDRRTGETLGRIAACRTLIKLRPAADGAEFSGRSRAGLQRVDKFKAPARGIAVARFRNASERYATFRIAAGEIRAGDHVIDVDLIAKRKEIEKVRGRREGSRSDHAAAANVTGNNVAFQNTFTDR